jgi:hypothetical protein
MRQLVEIDVVAGGQIKLRVPRRGASAEERMESWQVVALGCPPDQSD